MRAARSLAALPRCRTRDAVPIACGHGHGQLVRPITTSPLRAHRSGIEHVKATPWARMASNQPESSTVVEAPIPRKVTAYIALGSNLGDRTTMIETACKEMDARNITIKRTSSLWETEPMYVLDQDRFLNGACEVETDLEPLELLDALQDIENSMGRTKVVDKGPRNIDLDILLYDGQTISHPRLKVPHAGIREREFVLRPLAELAPTQALDESKPWKLAQDYLNRLTPSDPPLSTMTPVSPYHPVIQSLNPTRRTYVMGILNLTPDSFSDGGANNLDNIEATIEHHLAAGASILDVGGQSTSPGTPEVTADEELSRILPVIKLIRRLPAAATATISVDTYRATVAEAALAAGADIINDVSAGLLDDDMLPTVARAGKSICLMHMRGTPATMNQLTDYPRGVVEGVAAELLERVRAAEAAGVRRWRIILDPGIGFAKTGAQNLELLRHLDVLRDWPGLRGLPWLLGTSRKTFIGRLTGAVEPRHRAWGTAATVAAAVQGGADIVRVHDVKEMMDVVRVSDAIWRAAQ